MTTREEITDDKIDRIKKSYEEFSNAEILIRMHAMSVILYERAKEDV